MVRIRSTAPAVLAAILCPPLAFAQSVPDPGSSQCQASVARETAAYVRSSTRAVDKCLSRMSALVIEGASPATAAADAAEYCARRFAVLEHSGELAHIANRFHDNIARDCAGPDTAALGTANLGEYCGAFGGDAAIDTFYEWLDCLRASGDAAAREAIATRWPRALEWFEALAGPIAALPPGPRTTAARTALTELDAAIEGAIEDNKPDPRAGMTALLDTGAQLCVVEQGSPLEDCPTGARDQDGNADAGLDARHVDNGDGTVTDLVTGLVWEKLGDDGSIHDVSDSYTLAAALEGKIAQLNAGEGFAGHTDWRLPNRRELGSLVDASGLDPAIRPVFDDGCAPGCSADACSCVESQPYWTSTAYQPDPNKQWVVDFFHGTVSALAETSTARVRAVRGGARVAAAAMPPAAIATSSESLAACQAAVAKHSSKYVRVLAGAAGECLGVMSAEVLGNGAAATAAAEAVVPACVKSLRRIVNSAAPAKELASRLESKVAAKCDPAVNPKLTHLDADIWTIGDRTLSAANLAGFCASAGGNGTIDSFGEWLGCVRSAAEEQARQAVAVRWPRALEYLAALEAALAGAPASAETADALAALRSLDEQIEGETDDDLPEPPLPAPARLLATGQTQCVQADRTMGACPGVRPGQDGELQIGVARRYTDNGDGTITDHFTGLMWEKQSADGSIHDMDHIYFQQGAHYNKVKRLNHYAFAGYTDWRLPNRLELESLVDAGRSMPAIDPIFHDNCVPGCSVLECSCTASDGYRSSTYQPRLSHGTSTRIHFEDGAVSLELFESRVRAVRAGNVPPKPASNEPPVTYDISIQYPWGFDCVPITMLAKDLDSPYEYAFVVTPPVNGFVTDFVAGFRSAPAPESPGVVELGASASNRGVGQIAALVPDYGDCWGPFNDCRSPMGTTTLPDDTWGWGSTFCYVPFSATFTGTDSFTYRVADTDGNFSNESLVSITIFEY
jgi:hypothetical protein